MPDGKIATLSRVASAGKLETETADVFVTTQATIINSATYFGLLPVGTPLSNVTQVEIELYHVFPVTRRSRPTAASSLGQIRRPTIISLHVTAKFPASSPSRRRCSITALNSVVNGINPLPNQFTGGEGPVTGEEVRFNVTFTSPFIVGKDHIFFRPEVGLSSRDFLWLSAPKPIVSPGTAFTPDLQTWIRTDGAGALAPDWERIGTDVTHEGPFNAAFSLTGTTVPEPSTLLLLCGGLLALVGFKLKKAIA